MSDEPKWQPISTAPKDMTFVLLYGYANGTETQAVGAWNSDLRKWVLDRAPKLWMPDPTHWQPLPEPPEAHHAPRKD